MKTLPIISPTPEQLPLIQNAKPGIMLIRGAAGSGKTTTALIRLRQLAGYWLARRTRIGQVRPVRILVATYNRTLRGYISELATQQLQARTNLSLTVSTVAKWSRSIFPNATLVPGRDARSKILTLGATLGLKQDFLLDEVDYILGRFVPGQLDDYLGVSRHGRGSVPRVERPLRQRILSEVVEPYQAWKRGKRLSDWNDLAIACASVNTPDAYDVIIADEVQDLSANEVRALMHYAAKPSSITFVLDAAQRIYPRGFTWKEVGVNVSPADSHRLTRNHRNTVEICRFAFPLLEGMELDDDGTFPNFKSCTAHGPVPVVLEGRYTKQVNYALEALEKIDLATESVAFLKPRGGRWFDYLAGALSQKAFRHVMITRAADWPTGPENIALSTMYSAKGLEFDHVMILGLNDEVTPHGQDAEDTDLLALRRLLAMAITRARKTVLLGYKPGDASKLVTYLVLTAYQKKTV